MFLLSSFFCISLLILRNVVFLFLLLASGMVLDTERIARLDSIGMNWK